MLSLICRNAANKWAAGRLCLVVTENLHKCQNAEDFSEQMDNVLNLQMLLSNVFLFQEAKFYFIFSV